MTVGFWILLVCAIAAAARALLLRPGRVDPEWSWRAALAGAGAAIVHALGHIPWPR